MVSTFQPLYTVGFILKIPFLDSPKEDTIFDDGVSWNVAEEGYPGSGDLPLNGKSYPEKHPEDTQM